MMDECVVCQLPNISFVNRGAKGNFANCDRCGIYCWHPAIGSRGRENRRVKMSGFIREQNVAGIEPEFTRELVAQVEHLTVPGLEDRATRLLAALVRVSDIAARERQIIYHRLDFEALTYSTGINELDLLADILCDRALTRRGSVIGKILISTAGFIAAERLAKQMAASIQAFVAMPFATEYDAIYTHGFDPAIRRSGYKPLRIDQKEHSGAISDAILSEIRRSRFMVADYTDANNGVYFEAGFALGLGLTVIATCRKDWLPKLHFDVRHINTLHWEKPQDLVERLSRRISAIMGDGPNKAL